MVWYKRNGAAMVQPSFRAAGNAVAEWNHVNSFGACFYAPEPSPIRIGPESGVDRVELLCLDRQYREVQVVITPSRTETVTTTAEYWRINAGRVVSSTHAKAVTVQMKDSSGAWVDAWFLNNYTNDASTFTVPYIAEGDPWRVLQVETNRSVRNGTFECNVNLEIRKPEDVNFTPLRRVAAGRSIQGFDFPLMPGTDLRCRLMDIVSSATATGMVVTVAVTLEQPG